MTMVHWKCAVPGCKSKKDVPGHFFPKRVSLSDEWKKAVQNPYLILLNAQDLRKYRVCFRHFQQSDYILTFKRRRLKDDAIPSLLLDQPETSEISETAQIENFVLKSGLTTAQPIDLVTESGSEQRLKECNLEDPTKKIIDGNVVPHWSDLNIEKSADDDVLENLQRSTFGTSEEKLAIENVLTKLLPDWNSSAPLSSEVSSKSILPNNDYQSTSVPACSNLIAENCTLDKMKTPTKQNSLRPLLGDITRKNKLTPVARRLMTIAEKLKKSNNKYIRKCSSSKERLAEATNFVNSSDMQELKNLNPTQRRFFEMQLRNVSKKPQVSFS